MVVVGTVKRFDMQRYASGLGETVEPMFEHLGVHLTEALLGKFGLPNEEWATRNVDRDAGERFVHWAERVGVPPDTALVAERLRHCLANGKAGILNRVMLVNVQVANRLDIKVDQRMARKLFEHVVEKADAGRDGIAAGAVEIDGDVDRSLTRLAADRRGAHARHIAVMTRHAILTVPAGAVGNGAMTASVPDSLIPYDEIVQEALRAVVGRVLDQVAATGALPGGHHFYITFRTRAPGVDIPARLIERFPDEMTIVIQHRFWDLTVDDERFSVGLSFNQIPSLLVIPFSAITGFHDPAVNFELRFQAAEEPDGTDPHEEAENDGPAAAPVEDGSNVVAVDFKRKK